MRANPIEGGKPGRVMRIVVITPPLDTRLAVVLTPTVRAYMLLMFSLDPFLPQVIFPQVTSIAGIAKAFWTTGLDQGIALPPNSMVTLRLPFVYSIEGKIMGAQEMGPAAIARNSIKINTY